VITNRNRKFAEITLRKLGIKNYFEEIVGGDDVNCMKPSACPLDRLSSKIEMKKSKTIIVGDMDIDIRTGKNFGIKTCWVTYGLGNREDIEKIKPDYIIDDIIELKNIIR
jgi:phosphoglycolate phosphatase-like HAD superfamily hydrolase